MALMNRSRFVVNIKASTVLATLVTLVITLVTLITHVRIPYSLIRILIRDGRTNVAFAGEVCLNQVKNGFLFYL